jgi:heme exporter protein CcmD
MNLLNVFSMGNYGAYVWTAYGFTLLAFGLNIFVSLREQKHVRKIIRQYLLQTNSFS